LSSSLSCWAPMLILVNPDSLQSRSFSREKSCGIPFSHVLINCTHTHHAPSSCTVHGYARDEVFSKRTADGVVKAVKEAHARRVEADFFFARGEESSVGQNSRLLLKDNGIFWIGPRDDVVRPTGPFDPELPVLSFRGKDGKPVLTKDPKLVLNDNNAGKAEGIHLMIGRRPRIAFGNTAGDQQMLEYTAGGTGARLSLLVLHDDAKREYAYGPAKGLPDTKVGAFSQALYDEATKDGWVVISMKDDWKTIFSFDK